LSERLSDDEGFRDRLLRAPRVDASLDHPNVVPIYEAGEAEGRLFIAMRYVDGTDLKVLLRREGALTPERAVAIAAQVADALDAAHAKGLVHRDVKPSNVLLDQQGGREHAYLADFGLTQSIAAAGPAGGSLCAHERTGADLRTSTRWRPTSDGAPGSRDKRTSPPPAACASRRYPDPCR